MRRFMVVMLVLLLASCAPSEESIQQAIAQTQAAFTATSNPTATNTPAPTVTNTAAPTATPDLLVIDSDPRKLLLRKDQLPAVGRYYLPSGNGWLDPLKNSEIVSAWTVEEGQQYLAETGRIHGWIIGYARGTNGVIMPEQVYDNVVIYATTSGAQLIVTKFANRDQLYTEIEAPRVGDVSRALMRSETKSGGGRRVWIAYGFSYRNVYHSITLWGWEQEVSLDFAIDLANTLLEELKTLPLYETVTFSP